MLSRHARTLSKKQQQMVLAYLSTSRHPVRNRVIAMLSYYGGLRAVEIQRLKFRSILTSDYEVSDSLEIYNATAKGSRGGRAIPMHPDLKAELELLYAEQRDSVSLDSPVISSTRNQGKHMAQNSITVWFKRLYNDLNIDASSHSGRRSLARSLSKKVDVFTLKSVLGHRSIQTTMLYVDVNSEEKAKAIASL
jgi:integrase/recombinase XerD